MLFTVVQSLISPCKHHSSSVMMIWFKVIFYLFFASQTAAVIDETKTKTRKALSEAQRENEAQLQTAKLRLVFDSVPLCCFLHNWLKNNFRHGLSELKCLWPVDQTHQFSLWTFDLRAMVSSSAGLQRFHIWLYLLISS